MTKLSRSAILIEGRSFAMSAAPQRVKGNAIGQRTEEFVGPTDFVVDPETYAEFLARFDAPQRPNARLRRALQTPAPWEK